MSNRENLTIKLIALDMDGTLLDNKHEISSENKEAIMLAQEKGVHVVLSTGRSFRTSRDIAKELELTSYLVTVNGSEIWNCEEELIDRKLLEPELIEWMWDLSQQHKTNFWATSCNRVWHGEIPKRIRDHEWLKFGFHVDDDSTRMMIEQELKSNGRIEVSNSSPKNIEANCLGVNKAEGLKKVCSLVGITMEQVMACGDSLNDLAMVKESGLGVAMENAQDELKRSADWITLSNKDSGVAHAIHKWVL
ncbi:Cof-type HAD-IIB family hydrolase [Bacillus dakarensis]|uniref:Cof-type HAD-IIB family hydrolase n=1 Tax=Robertmurraya dakarensis TaxID=1926278 RepID=UPI000980C27E|nr:Cof-type HAD-IIB family hydrolase [Bacillus dakarensis]